MKFPEIYGDIKEMIEKEIQDIIYIIKRIICIFKYFFKKWNTFFIASDFLPLLFSNDKNIIAKLFIFSVFMQ